MNLPNYITILRIILVPFFFIFLIYFNSEKPDLRIYALCIFVVAMATDALDGLIARRFNQQTKIGTFLDPFADKLLLISGFLAIAFSNSFVLRPALWIIVVIIFRDLFIICGLVIIYLTVNRIEIKPNLIGKVTTFAQMLTVLSVLIQWTHAEWLWDVTVALTIVSWVVYIWHGIRLLNASGHAKKT